MGEIEEGTKLGARVVSHLRPPHNDDPAVTAWRWFVVVAVVLTAIGLLLHVALACGLFSSLHTGFAFKTDLDPLRDVDSAIKADQAALRTELRGFRIERLESRIYNMRIRQCDAIYRGENPRLYTLQINDATRQYRELTGHDAFLSSCEELELSQHTKGGKPPPREE